MAGFVFRENRVPYYQRLFQRHDGVRQWWKTPKSPMIMYPYYALFGISCTASIYGMCRLTLGHKTWFSEG